MSTLPMTQHLTRLGQGEIPPPPHLWLAFGDPVAAPHWLLIAAAGGGAVLLLLLAVAGRAHRQDRREARRAERDAFGTDPLESPS